MNDTLNTPHYADYETNLETNFNTAMNMCGEKYSYDELMVLLGSDKIVEKQIAILKLNVIKSEKDAQILVSNLTGQDGKIREAVAFKMNELADKPQYCACFKGEKIFNTLLNGIMDINGNVCRQIILGKWFDDNDFQSYLCTKLPESINKILAEIEKLEQNSKQYVISKRNFQLYWCLEALYSIIDVIDYTKIKQILRKTSEFYDYTIREKTAKIIAKLNNSELYELKEKLKSDENYYVRRYFE